MSRFMHLYLRRAVDRWQRREVGGCSGRRRRKKEGDGKFRARVKIEILNSANEKSNNKENKTDRKREGPVNVRGNFYIWFGLRCLVWHSRGQGSWKPNQFRRFLAGWMVRLNGFGARLTNQSSFEGLRHTRRNAIKSPPERSSRVNFEAECGLRSDVHNSPFFQPASPTRIHVRQGIT